MQQKKKPFANVKFAACTCGRHAEFTVNGEELPPAFSKEQALLQMVELMRTGELSFQRGEQLMASVMASQLPNTHAEVLDRQEEQMMRAAAIFQRLFGGAVVVKIFASR